MIEQHPSDHNMDTELALLNWRDGQTKAERLCANILYLDGYSDVDPQCPLGGPDGLKDVLCTKNGWLYIGAVHFPTKQLDFTAIKKKFAADLAGVAKNGADGMAFLTNQQISPTERKKLQAVAQKRGHKSVIYHRERFRTILDSPIGFGHRLEYLGIEMSPEEQLSFFSHWGTLFEKMLQKQSEYVIAAVSKKLDAFRAGASVLSDLVAQLCAETKTTLSVLVDKQSCGDSQAGMTVPVSSTTGQLNVELLCMLHRAMCFDHSHPTHMGTLRTVAVWIGAPGSTLGNATYVPPAPDKVPEMMEDLLRKWREEYSSLRGSKDKDAILDAIVQFHSKFLSIHPFLDGNGRLSRFLLMQQATELLGVQRQVVLEDTASYVEALGESQHGDMDSLRRIISQALSGEEEFARLEPTPTCNEQLESK